MSFPFVASFHRYGTARGPRKAIIWHFAEGGGTVGYLSRRNSHGVAVHFVVEYSGRVVQMLRLDEMHGSIRTSDIRRTDDPDGFYGRTAARAVMAEWADTTTTGGPNHASIAVEIEGFARNGPNDAQADAMATLYRHLVGKYPGIRSLGHRDFQDYKACPGKLIPWGRVGGHGASVPEALMIPVGDYGPFDVVIPPHVGVYVAEGNDIYRQARTFSTEAKTVGFFVTATGWVAVAASIDGRKQLAFVKARDVGYSRPPAPIPQDVTFEYAIKVGDQTLREDAIVVGRA